MSRKRSLLFVDISSEQMTEVVRRLNDACDHLGGGISALQGLTILAVGFAALLDIYAKPNAENPRGMCDDPAAFRRHFAGIVAKGGAK